MEGVFKYTWEVYWILEFYQFSNFNLLKYSLHQVTWETFQNLPSLVGKIRAPETGQQIILLQVKWRFWPLPLVSWTLPSHIDVSVLESANGWLITEATALDGISVVSCSVTTG